MSTELQRNLARIYGQGYESRRSIFLTEEEQARVDQLALHQRVADQIVTGGAAENKAKKSKSKAKSRGRGKP